MQNIFGNSLKMVVGRTIVGRTITLEREPPKKKQRTDTQKKCKED